MSITMIYPTQYYFFGAQAHRDARTGRWASRAAFLAQVDRVAAQVAEARVLAAALMLALCRPVRGRRTAAAIHRELGDEHPRAERPLRHTTPGQDAWHKRNPVAWGHVEA